jgi:hypothetical protein
MSDFIKDPDAVLDYSVDWAAWLDTDTIATSVWSSPEGMTVVDTTNVATSATVWLSGGTVGMRYRITNHIVTAAGRENDRTISIRVQEQ